MDPTALLPALRGLRLSLMACLPTEILYAIFNQLDDPRDLHQASLVSHAWRRVATEDKLWEVHFWNFYRPVYTMTEDAEELAALQGRRRSYQRASIVGWMQRASASPLSANLFQEIPCTADQVAAGASTPLNPVAIPSTRQLSLPPFLAARATQRSNSSLPSFYRLFARQMNEDDALLQAIRKYADATAGLIDPLLLTLSDQRFGSRYLLAALCAIQRPTKDNITAFLVPQQREDAQSWPRALQVHKMAREGKTLPHTEYNLSLYHIASKALGHLQRRDALYALRELEDRLPTFSKRGAQTMRDWVTACCLGLEEASEGMALFRGTERTEMREYLDLLAVFVFSSSQAEDRQAAAGQAVSRCMAPTQSYPAGSTRHHMVRIVASLRALGFTTAASADLQDLDNFFPNVALYCPAQRSTHPTTLAIIVCAVARRLGIASSISKALGCTLIIAVEDGDQPAAWRAGEDEREWRRFFVEVGQPPQTSICESDRARGLLSGTELAKSDHAAQLEPADPLQVLGALAAQLMASVEVASGPVRLNLNREGFSGEDAANVGSSQLSRLRLYFEGRQPHPPAPLPCATFGSSIALLPPTDANGMRAAAKRMAKDAEYCARWIRRLVAPQQAGALDEANGALAGMIASSTSMFACDYSLLMQIDNWRYYKQGTSTSRNRPPVARYFEEQLMPVLAWDGAPGVGLGVMGGVDEPELRKKASSEALPRRLVDRSYPANRHVELGVGAVVRNRVNGMRGVVVGWDSECRRDEDWIAHRDFVSGKRSVCILTSRLEK